MAFQALVLRVSSSDGLLSTPIVLESSYSRASLSLVGHDVAADAMAATHLRVAHYPVHLMQHHRRPVVVSERDYAEHVLHLAEKTIATQHASDVVPRAPSLHEPEIARNMALVLETLAREDDAYSTQRLWHEHQLCANQTQLIVGTLSVRARCDCRCHSNSLTHARARLSRSGSWHRTRGIGASHASSSVYTSTGASWHRCSSLMHSSSCGCCARYARRCATTRECCLTSSRHTASASCSPLPRPLRPPLAPPSPSRLPNPPNPPNPPSAGVPRNAKSERVQYLHSV